MRLIGMISGTSFDSVDAAVADFEIVGEAVLCDVVAHRSVPFPPPLRTAIAEVLPPQTTTVGQICMLDVLIGQHFGDVARALVDEHPVVDAVCSHGQTVFHWVDGNVARGCIQLGQPAWIAERTGVSVVSDVRNADIAAGGQGAPLVSLLDVMLLDGVSDGAVGSLNLGGIANVTVVRADAPPVAFDIGPANALLDAAVQWATGGGEYYDRDGERAARGRVDDALVARILDDPYFDMPPPKSTGKELFNIEYLKARLGDDPPDLEDLLSTLTAATAEGISRALRPYRLRDLYVAGGGTRNATLMRVLANSLPHVSLRPTDELGVAEGAKEALLFALIGFLTLSGFPATVPSCTGASRPSLLGVVTPGPAGWAPSAGGHEQPSEAPKRLVVRTPLGRDAAGPEQAPT